MSDPDRAAIEREFDALMRLAGLPVLVDRKAGIVASYADLKRHAEIVRRPLAAADEPAEIYALDRILRGR